MLAPADRFPGAARVSSGQGAAVPAVTFPGVFALRPKAGLTKCSGLLVLDFVTPKLIRHPFRRDATVLVPDQFHISGVESGVAKEQIELHG
jgi:hypothetical protein